MAERIEKYRQLNSAENSFLYPPESLKESLQQQSEPPAIERGVVRVVGQESEPPALKHDHSKMEMTGKSTHKDD